MRRFILTLLIFLFLSISSIFILSSLATRKYGPPSQTIAGTQRLQYAAKILWHDTTISLPADIYGTEQNFRIENGESPYTIAIRLETQGLILDADAFITLLVYTGMDTGLMPGDYRLSPSLSMKSIAGTLQDTRASQVLFVILPGWRMEEVAASLPTSGLQVTEEEFLAAVRTPPPGINDVGASTREGFLFPDSYLLPRNLTVDQLLTELTLNFMRHLTSEIKQGLAQQGLTVYEGVTLASIIEREAVVADEQKIIASVFLNRLAAGQKLESDPTVQYALGYNNLTQSWWKNPLTYADLEVDSPYNAYLYPGLPPGPISNPSLGTLEAVGFPAETPYYFFRARCDGTGLHAFAETFAGHLANACN